MISGINVYKGSDENITIGTMCPKCFKKKTFNVNVSINSNISRNKFELTLVPYYLCPKCGEAVVSIDNDIVDDIVRLNKLGYKTKYCCSGHEYRADWFYVYFKNKNIKRDMDFHNMPLPNIFYFDENNKSPREIALRVKCLPNKVEEYEKMHTMILSEFHGLVNKLNTIKKIERKK